MDTPKDPEDLRLLKMLINKIIEKLEEGSYQPKVQDALKAIQLKHKLAPESEAEKTFWQLIDGIRDSELESSNGLQDLEAQILKTIMDLKDQVKNGALPVKIITDALNQGKSEQCQLTYHRIGRVLSAMGFTKVRTRSGASALLWDEERLRHLAEKYIPASLQDFEKIKLTSETSERSETSVRQDG
jgi:hypothetical protein